MTEQLIARIQNDWAKHCPRNFCPREEAEAYIREYGITLEWWNSLTQEQKDEEAGNFLDIDGEMFLTGYQEDALRYQGS